MNLCSFPLCSITSCFSRDDMSSLSKAAASTCPSSESKHSQIRKSSVGGSQVNCATHLPQCHPSRFANTASPAATSSLQASPIRRPHRSRLRLSRFRRLVGPKSSMPSRSSSGVTSESSPPSRPLGFDLDVVGRDRCCCPGEDFAFRPAPELRASAEPFPVLRFRFRVF